jgi:periplasmic protein TonB
MKTLSLSIFLLLISLHSFSQKKKEEEIFTAVEQQAEFPGGMGAFGKYLQKNLKRIDGEDFPPKLYLQFVVEKDGSISLFEVLRGPVSSKLEEQFISLLTKIKWKPGYQSGKPVRSRFTIPINHCPSE